MITDPLVQKDALRLFRKNGSLEDIARMLDTDADRAWRFVMFARMRLSDNDETDVMLRPLPAGLRAVLPQYFDALRGKVRFVILQGAARGKAVFGAIEADIVSRIAREIRKRIDSTTSEEARERAKRAHRNGCLHGRIAAILGCSEYEAEVWANLTAPREREALNPCDDDARSEGEDA